MFPDREFPDVYKRQIILYAVSIHKLCGFYHHIIGPVSLFIMAAGIMGLFRSVNRKSYQKMIFSQKAAPFLIQKRAVGLEGIMYLYSSAVVLILKLYRFSEKVQPPQPRDVYKSQVSICKF